MRDWILFSIIIIPLTIGLLIEASVILTLFFGADEIDCNFLWCEFKTTHRTIEENTIKIYDGECFQNGSKINCSNIPDINLLMQQIRMT